LIKKSFSSFKIYIQINNSITKDEIKTKRAITSSVNQEKNAILNIKKNTHKMPKSKYIATTSKRSNTPNAQSKSIAHNTEAVNPNKILIPQKALVKKIGENKKLNALKVDRELRRGE
jgi:hypothetical protein